MSVLDSGVIFALKSNDKQGGTCHVPNRFLIIRVVFMRLDVEEVLKSGKATINFLIEQGASNYLYFAMFEAAFIDLTNQVEANVLIENISYDSVELYQQCKTDEADNKKARRFVKEKIQQLESYFLEHRDEFDNFIKGTDVKSWLVICDDESQGKIKKQYFFKTIPIDDVTKPNNNEIQYYVSELPKPLPWAKFLTNLEMFCWKLYGYIWLLIVTLIISYFLLLWNFYAISSFSLVTSILLVSAFSILYFILKPFYEAMNLRIAIAPNWLLRLSEMSGQLRATRTDQKRTNGKSIRALQLVIYKADCPICGSEVLIEKGKYAHKARLVGVCDESPREHVFSFDHVTKTGFYLD